MSHNRNRLFRLGRQKLGRIFEFERPRMEALRYLQNGVTSLMYLTKQFSPHCGEN